MKRVIVAEQAKLGVTNFDAIGGEDEDARIEVSKAAEETRQRCAERIGVQHLDLVQVLRVLRHLAPFGVEHLETTLDSMKGSA